MNRALSEHWPEYLCEATALGIFMIFAGAFAVLFEFPGSSVHRAIADEFDHFFLASGAKSLLQIWNC
jgi:hypothetical protein